MKREQVCHGIEALYNGLDPVRARLGEGLTVVCGAVLSQNMFTLKVDRYYLLNVPEKRRKAAHGFNKH